jgi:hypothetical protein
MLIHALNVISAAGSKGSVEKLWRDKASLEISSTTTRPSVEVCSASISPLLARKFMTENGWID